MTTSDEQYREVLGYYTRGRDEGYPLDPDSIVDEGGDEYRAEFDRFLARVRRDAKAEAILMDGFDMAVADRLADAGYTEYAEDEDGGVTWVSAPLGEVLHIVRICATEHETGDRA